MGFWLGKRIVIGVSGGIAAYKSLELLRLLHREGAALTTVMTRAAGRFITPLSVQALSGGPVYRDLFSLTQEREMGHIQLARNAELVLVAPATADLMARLAGGHADDLLTALLLARRGPVLLAPAMNTGMWDHPATRRNVETLRRDGLAMVGPEKGSLACGEEGEGRMAEPDAILEAARRLLTPRPLTGKRLLLTAGPTREELDPVRYLSNHSSGRMGWGVALAALRAGAEVTLVHGPVELPPPLGAQCVPVTSAEEMRQACLRHWPECDGAILTAAVADYRPVARAEGKIKKERAGSDPTLTLTANGDILAELSATAKAGGKQRLVVGFAAETGLDLDQARAKLARKGCDWLVVNDVTEAGCGFSVPTNRVVLLGRNGTAEHWPLESKEEVGQRLIQAMTPLLVGAATV